MDIDPSDSFQPSPGVNKWRKVVAVHATPPRLADLLSAFGAQKLPASPGRMASLSGGRSLRPTKPTLTYAEAEESGESSQPSPGESNYSDETPKASATVYDANDSDEDADDHDSGADSDVIDGSVTPRPVATRQNPQRATRKQVSYATPKKQAKKKKGRRKGRKAKPARLVSDLSVSPAVNTEPNGSPQPEEEAEAVDLKTARKKFLLARKEYFLPVLPEENALVRLQRIEGSQHIATADIVPCEAITSRPDGVTAVMKPYQLDGLSFLVHMQRNGASAILGDEMGLGKTLQTLSLLQHLKNQTPAGTQTRPSLVVCPLSVLSSWMNEAKKWTPGLNVVRFHGPKSEREKLKASCRNAGYTTGIDVICTTYETYVSEHTWFKRAFVWRYCVLDEGHKIKDSKSDMSQALQGLRSEHRLLLTGTPLQNNLSEMWALLHWLYGDVFTSNTEDNFKEAFDLSRGKVSTSFLENARRLLELIMLRRMKSSPGVNLGLPPKEEVLLYVPLTPMQRFWYIRLLTKADNNLLRDLFEDAGAKELSTIQADDEDGPPSTSPKDSTLDMSGHSGRDVWAESKNILKAIQSGESADNKGDYRKLMNLVLQLRKVCSHPYILPNAAPDPYYLGDHIKNASGKFIVLDRLIRELVLKQGKKVLIFSSLISTLNLCEDLLTLQGANAVVDPTFRYVRFEGGTSRARRNLSIRMFNTRDEYKVMLISTRAGGLGINLASATDVVFMDEDWNPQCTLQAEARAHRIGQTEKVTVFHLCSQGTVEEQMLGRIRKKLYLSTKVTESMRNIHTTSSTGNKRKRGSDSDEVDEIDEEEEAPQLDTSSLKSLIRRGAQTLVRPTIDVNEMLGWSWETTLEKCQDQTVDIDAANDDDDDHEGQEEAWLNTMERVECAVFEGKKHQKEMEKEAAANHGHLNRADRRVGKNTTVMMDGFAINKEFLLCADWEAVPTLAGKDATLQEPKREKKKLITHQDFCQHCWDGGDLVLCSGCPRSYHVGCLDTPFKQKVKGMTFYCPQHECIDCQSKTSDAGGLIYRCRWCENGFCEDCLDWESANLLGDTLMEYEMLGHGLMTNAYYIECPDCVKGWATDTRDAAQITEERGRIAEKYQEFQARSDESEPPNLTENHLTPATLSEVGTPAASEVAWPSSKKLRKTL